MSDDVLKAIAALDDGLRGEITQLGVGLRREIATLGDDLRREITKSRGETAKLIEGVQISIDGIREDLTVLGGANDRTRKAGENTRDEAREIANSLANIERVLRKHGTRLDDLEKRLPKP